MPRSPAPRAMRRSSNGGPAPVPCSTRRLRAMRAELAGELEQLGASIAVHAMCLLLPGQADGHSAPRREPRARANPVEPDAARRRPPGRARARCGQLEAPSLNDETRRRARRPLHSGADPHPAMSELVASGGVGVKGRAIHLERAGGVGLRAGSALNASVARRRTQPAWAVRPGRVPVGPLRQDSGAGWHTLPHLTQPGRAPIVPRSEPRRGLPLRVWRMLSALKTDEKLVVATGWAAAHGAGQPCGTSLPLLDVSGTAPPWRWGAAPPPVAPPVRGP